MGAKNIFLSGMATGALVGFLISLNGFFGIGFGSFGGFLAYVFASILLSSFSVKKISEMRTYCEPSLKHLIPVAFLTFFLPVLGPAIGAPSSGLDYVGTITVFGAVGGLFWSTPFALWNRYMQKSSSKIDEEE